MEPATLLPVISLLLLVSVEYGGWSLVGFLTGGGQLGEFQEQFFRARPWRTLVGALGAHALGRFGGPWGRDREEWKSREMMDKEGGS